MKQFNFGLPLLLLAALAATANSQETQANSTTPGVTLAALVAEALEKNPELKFYEAEIAAAEAGYKTAGRWANPELSGGLGQKRVSGGGLSDEGVAWSASILQPLEWSGRTGLRKAIANQDLELARLGAARFKIALTGRMRTLAYDLFAAQEKAAATVIVAERFQSLREVLLQRDPAGLTPLLETRIIEATELTAQHKASNARLTAQTALLELNQLRGAAPDSPLTVIAGAIKFAAATNLTRTLLLAAARTNNFELRLRATELAQQGFRVDLARTERYPTLAIGPTYSDEKVGGSREQIIGVGFTLPLPLWNRNDSNVAAAKARHAQAEVSFDVATRAVQRQVLAAALTYETKLREIARWRPDAAQHFQEAAELADRHYRLGAVPITTYVELQQQYLEAVESLLDTKRAALAAAAELELLTGLTLPPSSALP